MALTMSAQTTGVAASKGVVLVNEEIVASEERAPLSDSDFKRELAAVIPHLRAFGRSLSGNRDVADDLVQETLLKA